MEVDRVMVDDFFDELLAEMAEGTEPTPVRTRKQVLRRITQLTRESGRVPKTKLLVHPQKWLASDYFVLMTVPVEKIQNPVPGTPKYPEVVKQKVRQFDTEPLLIDKNISKNPKTETWILDGKHRAAAAKFLKKSTVQAWVGLEAIPGLISAENKGQWWNDKKNAAQN